MDKKTFVNQLEAGCNFGFKGKEQKACQKTMMCNWDKCQQEQQELHASRLTDEDRKSCENKDWKKQFACQERITKKRGLLDKIANAAHCEVNKCPQIRKLNEKRIKNFTANAKSKQSKKSKESKWADVEACRVQHCSKEEDAMAKTRATTEIKNKIQYNPFELLFTSMILILRKNRVEIQIIALINGRFY